MKRQNNREIIDEMKLMLDDSPKLTLESFVMPQMEERQDSDFDGEEEVPTEDNVPMEQPEQNVAANCGIENELTQIRKIALSAINKLADKPTSQNYKTMKQIWNMVDRATEAPDEGKME